MDNKAKEKKTKRERKGKFEKKRERRGAEGSFVIVAKFKLIHSAL